MALAAMGLLPGCGARSELQLSLGPGGAPTQGAPDAAACTPKSLGGLVLWLDAAQGFHDDNGFVTSWDDQSGQQNDAEPSVAGTSAPVLVTGAIGGHPAVRFDGTHYLVIKDAASLQLGTGDFVVALVARHTTPTNVGWGYGIFYIKYEVPYPYTGPQLTGNTEQGTTQAFAQLTYHDAIVDTAQSGLNDGQPMLLVMHRRAAGNQSSLEIRLNGASSAIATGGDYAVDVSALGRPLFLGGTPNNQNVVGDIAEVVTVKGATPDADVIALEACLMAKYGL
jgi:hypothetical protein